MRGLRHNCVIRMSPWNVFYRRGILLLKLHYIYLIRPNPLGCTYVQLYCTVKYFCIFRCRCMPPSVLEKCFFFADSATDIDSCASQKLIVADSSVVCYNATTLVTYSCHIMQHETPRTSLRHVTCVALVATSFSSKVFEIELILTRCSI